MTRNSREEAKQCNCLAHRDKVVQTIGKVLRTRDVNDLLGRHVPARENLHRIDEIAGFREARVALKPPPVPPHSVYGDVSRRDAARHGTLD
eukprot:5583522-Pleurochrysis_carterae.AAC.1